MQSSSILFFVILCIMIAVSLIKPFLSKGNSDIWSPITIISLTFLYYIVKPSLGDFSLYGADIASQQYLFYLSSVLFLGSILLAFNITKRGGFPKWNSYFNLDNTQKFALLLFFIAMVCYIPFRGFRTSISVNDATVTSARTGFVSYFIDLISLFVAASCLAFIGLKNKRGLGLKKQIVAYIILYFTLVMFIVGGFRYRLVILFLALATTYHLYPAPRKINYKLLVPIGIAAYLLFSVMDLYRSYGAGIDLEAASSMTISQASKGAGESDDVFCYSIAVIDRVSTTGNYVYFEPIITAALMPIPRAFFPSKPDGSYMTDIETKIIGDSYGGAAMFAFAEAYFAFGIVGVILYGLFIGWFCKKIWLNYQNNKNSIGALLLLALMNGFVYQWIARGYMASAFNDFIYFVVLPFWFVAVFRKIIPSFR